MANNIITPAEYREAVDRGVHAQIGALTKEQNDRFKAVMRKIKDAENSGAMMTRAGIADDVRIILNDISPSDISGSSIAEASANQNFARGSERKLARAPKIGNEDF